MKTPQTPLQVIDLIGFFGAYGLNACPDFKGIKTTQAATAASSWGLNACPDFKGIKTMGRCYSV
jgi:hypothetical protein